MGRERWEKTDFAGMAATSTDREFKQGRDLLGRLHSSYPHIFFLQNKINRSFSKFVPRNTDMFVYNHTLDCAKVPRAFQARTLDLV